MKPLLSNQKSNQLTKSKIRDALFQLLRKKNYEKISITDIVSDAGVSRNSFYRNYNEKEDIVLEMSTDFGKGLLAIIGDSAERRNAEQWFTKILTEIKNNRELIKIILKCNFTKFLTGGGKKLVDIIFEPQSKNDYYMMCAYVSSLIGIIYIWADNDMQESVEYIAALCANVTNKAFFDFKFREFNGG